MTPCLNRITVTIGSGSLFLDIVFYRFAGTDATLQLFENRTFGVVNNAVFGGFHQSDDGSIFVSGNDTGLGILSDRKSVV